MSYHIDIVPVGNLKKKQLERCQELTNGQSGVMKRDLLRARANETGKQSVKAILLSEDDIIWAWVLLFPNMKTYFFVDESKRRQGMGTALMNAIIETSHDKPKVCPCNYDNSLFFYQFHESTRVAEYYGYSANVQHKCNECGRNHSPNSGPKCSTCTEQSKQPKINWCLCHNCGNEFNADESVICLTCNPPAYEAGTLFAGFTVTEEESATV